jgi:RNA polymerase sigma-70 factor (ECF subfamily)
VFNLFAIEGYTHEDIGELLNISAGTSKSNLHKARQKLKQMISEADLPAGNNNYNSGMGYSPIVAIKKVDINGMFFDKNIRE